jgi:predicted DNA-binding transcriptional regulator YafY
MNRIDRLFAIQTYLQSRRYVSAEQIAEKFGMSVRTVYRDIKALCESGIPVSFEPTKGYFIVRGYFLPPVSFTTEEASALLLMEGATRIFADKSIQKLYTAALTKIKAVLRPGQLDGMEKLSAGMGVQLPPCQEATYEYLAVLQSAIAERHIIQITYTNKEGIESTRQVEPIGLQFYAFAWHLMAWCHKRMEYRDFRVSRLQRVTDTSLPFTRKDHLSLQELATALPVTY